MTTIVAWIIGVTIGAALWLAEYHPAVAGAVALVIFIYIAVNSGESHHADD